jgi:hypothetical protein
MGHILRQTLAAIIDMWDVADCGQSAVRAALVARPVDVAKFAIMDVTMKFRRHT